MTRIERHPYSPSDITLPVRSFVLSARSDESSFLSATNEKRRVPGHSCAKVSQLILDPSLFVILTELR